VLAGCTSGSGQAAAGTYEEVVIAVPDWAGGKANAAVVGQLLQQELGVAVRLREVESAHAWDLLDQGEVQVILEDWGGLPDKHRLYVHQRRTVVPAGELGPVGQVGWYVPESFADRHPEVLRWEHLNDFAELFSTPDTGDRGRLLTGDPQDASYDETLIKALDLDYTTVPAGGEEELIEALRRAERGGGPVLAYWWQPHWLHEELDLAEVRLPPYTPGCLQEREESGCGYQQIPLRKFLNAEFAENGGAAAELLAGFTWSAEEQNQVARMIEGDGMTPEGAAVAWLEENPDRVADWLPADG
jgi:glycine betaine/proline transport system substrate-binding protein